MLFVFALAGLALKFPLIALAVGGRGVRRLRRGADLREFARLRRVFTRRRQALFGEQPA